MKKMGIVGFGAAAIGFLQGLIESKKIDNYEIVVFERGKITRTTPFLVCGWMERSS
jgi:pyrroline-5-carboxylate reductase